ncbi:hypothetical protein B5M09_003185 [Aphanomyces astaci]|uniref:Uncharacterized protein n=1 Tax=Aphanomyces astaci TaxID=112090 RepID=A0A425DBV9_APHAT|nr:hypothetical protein B5M09_003185 [Aphanomyces astaci]
MDVLLYAVFDWLEGHREVVAIDGDINMLTVVSDYKDFLLFAVDPLETPRYFALHDTTSCIMYWGLANDLLAIEHDESGVDGLHLVRQSSKFAFANVSMESLLAQQSVLLLPLSVGRHIVRDTLDPFGPCPVAVRALHRTITATIMTVLNVNSEAHATFLSLPSLYDGLVPPHSYYSKAWAIPWEYNLFWAATSCATRSDIGKGC